MLFKYQDSYRLCKFSNLHKFSNSSNFKPMCLNKTQPVSEFHSEMSGSRPRNSRSLSLWNDSGMSPLPLFNSGIKLLGKRFRAPVWHCANISSEWKLPKGGSHYQKQQSAKNRFDVGIVLHYYLKNLSWCKSCPQCNMSYILAVFSVFSTSACPCYCRVQDRCSAGKKVIIFEDPWTLQSVLICLPSEQLLQRQ